ncbi:MAG: type II toxin-antitoxin system HigB family toxin [Acidobacteria bacterium]|nr:type II toxin-antitoxin system HigB family toxin [Acidobacteriota bacterium]
MRRSIPLRIITKRKLRQFWEKNPDAKEDLNDWYNRVRKADWKSRTDLQADYPKADLVGDCYVFNIRGNRFRLITRVRFRTHCVYTLHVLTHKEYDREGWKDDCNC